MKINKGLILIRLRVYSHARSSVRLYLDAVRLKQNMNISMLTHSQWQMFNRFTMLTIAA